MLTVSNYFGSADKYIGSYEDQMKLKLYQIQHGPHHFQSRLFKSVNGKLTLTITKDDIIDCVRKECNSKILGINNPNNDVVRSELTLTLYLFGMLEKVSDNPFVLISCFESLKKSDKGDTSVNELDSLTCIISEIYRLRMFIMDNAKLAFNTLEEN